MCGLSLGGILALQYAIEHPEHIHALALIGTQYTMPKTLLRIQVCCSISCLNVCFRETDLTSLPFSI